MKIVLVVVLIVVGLLAVDRLFLFFEKKGWVYWRRSRPGSGNATVNAVLEAHAALEPRVRHVIEQRQKGGGISDSTGEPVEPVDPTDEAIRRARDGRAPDGGSGDPSTAGPDNPSAAESKT